MSRTRAADVPHGTAHFCRRPGATPDHGAVRSDARPAAGEHGRAGGVYFPAGCRVIVGGRNRTMPPPPGPARWSQLADVRICWWGGSALLRAWEWQRPSSSASS